MYPKFGSDCRRYRGDQRIDNRIHDDCLDSTPGVAYGHSHCYDGRVQGIRQNDRCSQSDIAQS